MSAVYHYEITGGGRFDYRYSALVQHRQQRAAPGCAGASIDLDLGGH